MAKQKRYTKEFRLEAARLVAEQGYTMTEAAQRLGVSGWSIGNWISKFRQTGELAPADAPQPVADNLLGRDFTATGPNQKWVADIFCYQLLLRYNQRKGRQNGQLQGILDTL